MKDINIKKLIIDFAVPNHNNILKTKKDKFKTIWIWDTIFHDY